MNIADKTCNTEASAALVKEMTAYLNEGQPVLFVRPSLKPYGIFKDQSDCTEGQFSVPADLPEESGAVKPYGVYVCNTGSPFITAFADQAVEIAGRQCLQRWWETVGRSSFPDAKKVLILCEENEDPARNTSQSELGSFVDNSCLPVKVLTASRVRCNEALGRIRRTETAASLSAD